MTSVNQASWAVGWPRPFPQITPQRWITRGQRRLDHVLETAAEIPFDDNSKIVLLSDMHRGDKSDGDSFAPNEALFMHALRHYYHHSVLLKLSILVRVHAAAVHVSDWVFVRGVPYITRPIIELLGETLARSHLA
jgi:hypothetical protein